MLRWTRRLLLPRMHPWPHRDSAGLGIVERGSHRGAPVIVVAVVTRVVGAIILAFPLPLAHTLAFATVVGVGAGGGGGGAA
jgi:hypothetical protein